jgi:putative permease
MGGRFMPMNLATTHKVGITLLVLAAIFYLGYTIAHTVSCLLLSFVLAYLLDPVVTLLERRRIRRSYGIILLYTLLTIIAFFCIIFLLPVMSQRWEALVGELPGYFQKLKQIALDLKGRIGLGYVTEEWSWLIDSVQSGADKVLARLGAGVYAAVYRVVFNLFNLLLAPILVLFMLYYKQETMDGIARWLPSSHRDFVLAVGREVNRSIGGFIRGQVIVSIIVAVLSFVAMLLLDVRHPVFCAIFAGVASIIPFIGVIIATVPPLFFAFAEFQNGLILFQVIIAFSVIYFLEGYVIKPLVFKESMDLNPLVTIIMIMALGELLGFWGILLAVPITGAIKIFCTQLRNSRDRSSVTP